MRTSHLLNRLFMTLVALVALGSAALAADPGLVYPPTSEVSDQKAGSVLIYNLYSSVAASPETENTQINITNTNPFATAFVHLFFVDGASCTPADVFICLTPNQTASFLASDIDPGVMGYIVAVASDPVIGCPINFNFLIGSADVRLASGHSASLGAEAFSALYGVAGDGLPGCDMNSVTANLDFNGVVGAGYNRVPRVLAVDSIPSPADGNNTLLVINRIGGSLVTGASRIGSLFGLLFDDAENAYSFTFAPPGCQFKGPISSIRLLNGGLSNIIPSGRTGWMKFWATVDAGLLGAVLKANSNVGTSARAFTGGHNLHKLTFSAGASLTIPIFSPFC